jgi:hypothetical protein
MGGAAGRWWVMRIIPTSVVYIFTLMICMFALEFMGETPWRYLVALLPVIPVGLGTLFFVGYVRRLDEMQRRIQLEALAFSVGVTGVLTFAVGMLEAAGLPRLSPILVYPLLIFCWSLGLHFANKRYSA